MKKSRIAKIAELELGSGQKVLANGKVMIYGFDSWGLGGNEDVPYPALWTVEGWELEETPPCAVVIFDDGDNETVAPDLPRIKAEDLLTDTRYGLLRVNIDGTVEGWASNNTYTDRNEAAVAAEKSCERESTVHACPIADWLLLDSVRSFSAVSEHGVAVYHDGRVVGVDEPGEQPKLAIDGGFHWPVAVYHVYSIKRLTTEHLQRDLFRAFGSVLKNTRTELAPPPAAEPAAVNAAVKQLTFNLGSVSHVLRWIEPGRFMMGSPEDEPERFNDETLHEVVLSEGFWLGETTCTQELWQAVMGNNPSHFKGLLRPVEQVSWDDVQDFLERLNRMVPGLDACLPTEAQWEHACRAGTTTPFSFGEAVSTDQVNFDGRLPYAGGPEGIFRGETVDVHALPCNQWGLRQMHGNVWEWCQDFYGPYAEATVVDPAGPDAGSSRVVRGGSWSNYGRFCRSALRYRIVPANRYRRLGFRICARGNEK